MPTKNNGVSNWVGWVFFAGFMMILLGIFQGIAGLTALLNSEWLLVTEQNLLVFDFTTWGWIHLLVGLTVLVAGFSVMHGSTWARVVGVLVAGLSMIANLASINTYPLWSLVVITINVLVIYALTVHGAELKDVK